MTITANQTDLTIVGAENAIKSLTIDGQKIDFTAFNGNLESVTYGTNITVSLFGFGSVDEAFYGFNPSTGGGGLVAETYRHGVYVIEVPTQRKFN